MSKYRLFVCSLLTQFWLKFGRSLASTKFTCLVEFSLAGISMFVNILKLFLFVGNANNTSYRAENWWFDSIVCIFSAYVLSIICTYPNIYYFVHVIFLQQEVPNNRRSIVSRGWYRMIQYVARQPISPSFVPPDGSASTKSTRHSTHFSA